MHTYYMNASKTLVQQGSGWQIHFIGFFY